MQKNAGGITWLTVGANLYRAHCACMVDIIRMVKRFMESSRWPH